jgi:Putative transmembrane protein (PGPGW)
MPALHRRSRGSHHGRQGQCAGPDRARPGLAQLWRVGVFAAGLLCVAIGLALAVLPGPLTIPPVLLGLWVWSTEFDWARRFFLTFRSKARATWRHVKQHPLSSALVTMAGLVGVAVVVWAVGHFALVDRVKPLVGL